MKNDITCLLLATPGENALSIMTSAKKNGIRTAVIFSEAEANLHSVLQADMTFKYEGAFEENQLKEFIIKTALNCGAEAIYPTESYLAADAAFVKQVIGKGLIWIGPNPDILEKIRMNSELTALSIKSEIEIIPGYYGLNQNPDFLFEKAMEIGFPLMLKAAAGYGGKGFQLVYEADFLRPAIESAVKNALENFGDSRLNIQQYLPSVRHFEIQILSDKYGSICCLSPIETTLQRNFQNLIAETARAGISADTLVKMQDAALRLCKNIGIDNFVNVHFLYSEDTFYLLKIKAGLSEAYSIFEAQSANELFDIQLNVAQGQQLDFKKFENSQKTHVLQCYIYAEIPQLNFQKSSGIILDYYCPKLQDVHIESLVNKGTEVNSYHNSIAKITVSGTDRTSAIDVMKNALRQFRCQGIETNQLLLLRLLENPHFIDSEYDTHFIHRDFSMENELNIAEEDKAEALMALILFVLRKDQSTNLNAESNNYPQNFLCAGSAIEIVFKSIDSSRYILEINNKIFEPRFNFIKENEISLCLNENEMRFFIAKSNENSYFVQHPSSGSMEITLL